MRRVWRNADIAVGLAEMNMRQLAFQTWILARLRILSRDYLETDFRSVTFFFDFDFKKSSLLETEGVGD